MASVNKEFTAQEMLAYRDEVVRNLREEILLLDELKEQGLFEKSEGFITKENYPEKIAVIEGEIKKLENFDVVLAVVGTMKSGKSTTINAIVGREILPNRNRPMTALPTLIYHNPKQIEPILSFRNPSVNVYVKSLQQLLQENPNWMKGENVSAPEMQDLMQQIKGGWHFNETYTGESEIFEFLAKLNDLVRLAETLRLNYGNSTDKLQFPFESCRNIDELPKIEVAFRYLSDLKENQGRLILLDTPGPNEAGQEHLRDMLAEQLQRSSAVLLILDYTQLKSEASESVKQQLMEVPSVSKERLFALVNKFDQQNANSDDEEETKNIILKDFLSGKVEREHIFPLSAGNAFLANRMQTELELHGKPAWNKEKWVVDFAKLAYGMIEREEWEEDYDEDSIAKKIMRIVKNSKIQAPLETAIIQTQLEAPRIAMKSALEKLKDLLEDLSQCSVFVLRSLREQTEEEKNNLQAMVSRLSQHIITLTEMQKSVRKEILEVKEEGKSNAEEQIKKTKENIKSELENLFLEKNKSLKEEYDEKKQQGMHMIPYEENKKRKEDMDKLKHLLQVNEGDKVSLKTKQEQDEVIDRIASIYRDLIQGANVKIEKTVDDGWQQIQEKLKSKHTKISEIFSDIENQYKKEGIAFFLTLPKFEILARFKYVQPNIIKQFESEKVNTTIEKTGLLNSIRRFFGFESGYETKSEIYYTFSKKGILEMLSNDLDEGFSRYVKGEISRVFDSLSDDWVEEYIGGVRNRAENLLQETEYQINNNLNEIKNKEQIEKAANSLLKRNGQIKEDIDNLNKKFDIEGYPKFS